MADEGHEFSGKTVEEATEEGLAQLGLSAAQAEVEVLSRGSRGIFGIGSEPARVRIVRRAASTSAAATSAVVTPAASASNSGTVASQSAAPDPAAVAAQKPTAPTAPAAKPAKPAPDLSHDDDTDDDPDTDAGYAVEEPAEAFARDSIEDLDEEELATLAHDILAQLVEKMGFQCAIDVSWRDPADDESERYLHLDINGNDLGALIGRRGETLSSIQYLVRLMVNQRIRQWKPIVVDVENYKERRNNQLTQLALRMADQVVQSGRAMSLEPMPANERRIIHLTLRDHAEVYTQSSGEGDRRKVHIVAKE